MNNIETEAEIIPIIQEEHGEYRVNLPIFEGPFDLLLYLIRKHDLEIQDIPIAKLTSEYLAYIDTMKTLNIDLAGEFLLMAADLMHIKSQMLLPITPDIENEEIADPRADLVRRLMEYQRFKDAANQLVSRNMLLREVFVPIALAPDLAELDSQPAPLKEGNVYDLIEAFDKVLRKIPTESFHSVAVDRVSVNEKIYSLAAKLQKGRSISIEDLLPKTLTRYDIVVTFLALLEMARLRMVTLFQGGAKEFMYISAAMDLQDVDEKELQLDGSSETESYR